MDVINYFIAGALLLTIGCASQRNIAQGVSGQVTWESGNQMPGIDRQAPPAQPYECEIAVFPVLTVDDAIADNMFFKPASKPVSGIKTDKNGNYQVPLPPGKYSVLVVVDDKYFGNTYNGKGEVNAVEVTENKIVTMDILVNYDASY